MSPQANKVLDALRFFNVQGATTRTIGERVNTTPDAVRRCLGELKRAGYDVGRIGGTKLVRLYGA